ncbi:MAG: aminoglycoside phosphotransferase family protein, partial [Chloroflexota bacterium]|nr:aminoglycoside phosphotransferase family protein [Chloroflexota bacterium]
LGHLAAPYLRGQPLPKASWLTHSYGRVAASEAAPLLAAARDPLAWRHPLLHPFTPELVAAMLELWECAPALLTRMERGPQTLCHHDVWRHNLFTRVSAEGQQQTVAIDWELMGVGAAGEDAGNLLFVSLLNMDQEMADAPALAAALQQAYVEGLCEQGWRDDTGPISFAFRVAALRCIFSTITWPIAIVQDQTGRFVNETEQRWQRPLEAVLMTGRASLSSRLRSLPVIFQRARTCATPTPTCIGYVRHPLTFSP